MRNIRAWSALTGLVVSVALGMLSGVFQMENPAWCAVLDGFSINTQDKAVTVTLYTDQRTAYTTETQGRQFTIVLPNAQLAPSQVEEGLPVVIDNKNRFIGRAVPTDDGQVKIILPNLPAEEFTVSIQQQTKTARPTETPTTTTASSVKPAKKPIAAIPAIKPRPAILETDEQAFERVTAKFQQKKTASATPRRNPEPGRGLRLSSAKSASAGSTIWNPYVVRNQPTEVTAEAQQNSAATTRPATSGEPVSAISLAETPARPSAPPVDPLWYLHSLPPAEGLNTLLSDDLQGMAKAATQSAEPSKPKQAQAQPQPAPERPIHELKAMIKKLPAWLWITLGIFFSGLGLFGLIGAAVLLKVLFIQAKPQAMQPAFVMAQPMPVGLPDAPARPTAAPVQSKPAYASTPRQVLFQDTSSINALDYLKNNARSVSEAVQNSTLLRFPHTRRANNAKLTRHHSRA